MSDLSKSQLDNLATLSKLYVNDNEFDKLNKDLSNILNMIEQIQQVDTNSVKPMAHPLDTKQALRDDESKQNILKAKLQSLSQHIVDDMYQVPKVID